MTPRVTAFVAMVALLLAAAVFLLSTMRALGQCERVNRLRTQDNVSEAVIYRTLTTAAEANRRRSDPTARRAARWYGHLASFVTYTPLTDCREAVLIPLWYEAPPSVRFVEMSEPEIDKLVPRLRK